MGLLKSKKLWAFLGGVVVSEVLKSNTVHNIAVKTVANTMKAQKKVKAYVEDIKQEAEDLCYDEACLEEENLSVSKIEN